MASRVTVRRLRDFAEVSAGLNVTRIEHDPAAQPARLISLKDVAEQIAPVEALGLIHAAESEIGRFRVAAGDVLVTARGSAIRAVVVRESHEKAVAGTNLAIVRVHDGLHPVLLAAFLRDPRTRTTLLRDTVGASTPGFTIRALSALTIHVPSLERQAALTAIVEASESHRAALIRATELRAQVCRAIVGAELFPRSAASD